MVVFVSAVEDTLIILIQIFLYWLCFTCWGLIFGPKFQLLFGDEQAAIDASKSDLPQEKSNGFSFASVAAMTAIQLKQYYHALKIQIVKCETSLKITPPAKFADIKSSSPAYYAPVSKPLSKGGGAGNSVGESSVAGTSRHSAGGDKVTRQQVNSSYHANYDTDDSTNTSSVNNNHLINLNDHDSHREKFVLLRPSEVSSPSSSLHPHPQSQHQATTQGSHWATGIQPVGVSTTVTGSATSSPRETIVNIHRHHSSGNGPTSAATPTSGLRSPTAKLVPSTSPTSPTSSVATMARPRLTIQTNALPISVVDNDSTIVLSAYDGPCSSTSVDTSIALISPLVVANSSAGAPANDTLTTRGQPNSNSASSSRPSSGTTPIIEQP